MKKSPGRRRVVSYTSSAALHCRSVLSTLRMARRTRGRISVQHRGELVLGGGCVCSKSCYKLVMEVLNDPIGNGMVRCGA